MSNGYKYEMLVLEPLEKFIIKGEVENFKEYYNGATSETLEISLGNILIKINSNLEFFNRKEFFVMYILLKNKISNKLDLIIDSLIGKIATELLNPKNDFKFDADLLLIEDLIKHSKDFKCHHCGGIHHPIHQRAITIDGTNIDICEWCEIDM